jgi:hypothetical protein
MSEGDGHRQQMRMDTEAQTRLALLIEQIARYLIRAQRRLLLFKGAIYF